MVDVDKSKKHSEYLSLLGGIRIDFLPQIDLSKALYLDSLYIFDLNWIKVIKVIIRNLLFDIPELDIKIKNNELLMLTTIYGRSDHDGYWDSIKELFPVKDEIILNNNITVKKYIKNISVKGAFKKVKKYWHACKALNVIQNKLYRSYLASKIITCEKYINEIKNRIQDTKIVIAFCDTFLFENTIIQYLHNQGVICITNQHGQPVFRGWNKDHLNQSQIFNFSSDYYLAKGNFSKKQFIKAGFDEKKIVVLGSMNKTVSKLHSNGFKKVFGVFTDCILYDFAGFTNKKIIKMAAEISEKINMSYYIKIHPLDKPENYQNIISHRCIGVYKDEYSNNELFQQIEFGLISASAIYLDMLYANVKCYQVRTEINFPIVENSDDIFENCDQFIDKLYTWRQLPETEKEMHFTEQQKEYGLCDNTGQRIQNFVQSLIKAI